MPAKDPQAEAKATLAKLVIGCRDDDEGVSSKKSLVESFMTSSSQNLTEILLAMHVHNAVSVDGRGLIKASKWQHVPMGSKTPRSGSVEEEAGNHGMFLASVLSGLGEGGGAAMSVVDQFCDANPHVDVIELLRYINAIGFFTTSTETLMNGFVVNWKKPPPPKQELPSWTRRWMGTSTPSGPHGASKYVTVRDTARGRSIKLCFLGSVDPMNGILTLDSPQKVFDVFGLRRPRMLVNTDAGSMHPRKLDENNMLHNLPGFCDWVAAARAQQNPKEAADLEAGGAVDVGADWKTFTKKGGGLSLRTKGVATLNQLMQKTIDQWHSELEVMDTDKIMGTESSINTLIFTKLTEVFGALLDSVKVNDSWILVDRTEGKESATAEYLLEMALEKGATRPNIIVIDSLERLGQAHDGCNSGRMMKQLSELHDDENCVTGPNGTEKTLNIDFYYDVKQFESSEAFHDIKDNMLPFDVLAEHTRRGGNNTCDPKRKWRYFYVDSLFSSATHYVIKTNDKDEFNVDQYAPMGYLYAHGDTRTYKRLASNIQQGKSIVLLHNSGGCTTAFSWLQRVFKFQRPAPDISRLRAPLKFMISALSKGNWSFEFGVPEMLMMKDLAERAPLLFKKHVVSVDIMTNSEEQVLETITGCFSAGFGGVPELGLGNAETNVIYNAWNLHFMLCQNAKVFLRLSKVAQAVMWTLAIATTTLAIFHVSISGGAMKDVITDPKQKTDVVNAIETAVLLIPIGTAFASTILAKLLWRDKWSICLSAASQLAAEIYKFRMNCIEYDPRAMTGPLVQGGEDRVGKATMARKMFVDRVQAMYGAALTELSQTGALSAQNKKAKKNDQIQTRSHREDKLTLSQWLIFKRHTERFFYKTSWTFPTTSFQSWFAGLRPYLHGPSLREEVKAVIESLLAENKIVLMGVPLNDTESKMVRQEVAKSIGLKKTMLDGQKDEIIKIQREIVTQLWREKQAQQAKQAAGGQGNPLDGIEDSPKKKGAKVVPVDDDDDDVFTDSVAAMRKHLLELQGIKVGRKTANEIKEEKKNKNKSVVFKEIEDDYLCGPLSIESYVVYRVRPIVEKFEKHCTKLAWRLQAIDLLSFLLNSLGTVLAACGLTEFVSLSVALVFVLNSIIEFSKLRDEVVSSNLALRDMQSILVDWDSLSMVKRRSPDVKAKIVDATEESLIAVVVAHTTAASVTQISVKRKLALHIANGHYGAHAAADTGESAE